jgi:hypothetical protein
MRLDVETVPVGPSASRLVVTGVIDWSTIAGSRARLVDSLAPPAPDVVVDLTGLLPWCPEAQQALLRAGIRARLRGGQLTVIGLPPIPRWQARDTEQRGPAAW